MIGRFFQKIKFNRKTKTNLLFSISCKNRRRNPTKTHTSLNDSMGKTKILKIYHLPPKTPSRFFSLLK